jgi:ELWxxDGT repeat protein
MHPSRGSQLWRTTGTSDTTVMVHQASSSFKGLARVDRRVYFSTYDALWVSDGTAGGTRLLRTFDETTGVSGDRVQNLAAAGGLLYFTAPDGSHGRELWASDGTVAGTRVVKRFAGWGEGPQELTEYRGKLYFSADDGTNGYELWTSDGTAAGTTLIRDTSPGWSGVALRHFIVSSRGLFFTTEVGGKGELWQSNGTGAGTVRLLSPPSDDTIDTRIRGVVAAEGSVFFIRHTYSVVTTTRTSSLWRTDGTPRGTVRVKELQAVQEDFAQDPTAVGRIIYFKQLVGNDVELWSSDGTEAGTHSVMSLGHVTLARSAELHASGETLFFPHMTTPTGRELWRLGPAIISRADVSGIVFDDRDADAKLDAGEPRLAGWRVFLDEDDDGRLDAGERWTRTGTSGSYALPSVVPGTYRLRVTPVAGFSPTGIDAAKIKAMAGGSIRRHFGQSRGAVVSGSVFRDNDRDGIWDRSEGALGGWLVFHDADGDGVLDPQERSTESDEAGKWRMAGLPSGSVMLCVAQPSGWRTTTPRGGTFVVPLSVGQAASGYVFGQKRIV